MANRDFPSFEKDRPEMEEIIISDKSDDKEITLFNKKCAVIKFHLNEILKLIDGGGKNE